MRRKSTLRWTYLDVVPNLFHIIAIILKPLVDSGDPPLAAGVVITDEILAVLIDGIVGQMHVHITLSVHVCVQG